MVVINSIDTDMCTCYNIIRDLFKSDAVVAQSVVRRIGSAEVTGSIPVSSSLKKQQSCALHDCCFLFYFFIYYGAIQNSVTTPFLTIAPNEHLYSRPSSMNPTNYLSSFNTILIAIIIQMCL